MESSGRRRSLPLDVDYGNEIEYSAAQFEFIQRGISFPEMFLKFTNLHLFSIPPTLRISPEISEAMKQCIPSGNISACDVRKCVKSFLVGAQPVGFLCVPASALGNDFIDSGSVLDIIPMPCSFVSLWRTNESYEMRTECKSTGDFLLSSLHVAAVYLNRIYGRAEVLLFGKRKRPTARLFAN